MRNQDISSCNYYEIGCNLTIEMLTLIQSKDDRDMMYKAIEYIIHFQTYEQHLGKIQDATERENYIAEKNALLNELSNDLKIDLNTLFILKRDNDV